MKLFRRAAALALAATLLLLAGCGKGEDSDFSSAPPATTAAPTTTAPVRFPNPLTGKTDMTTQNDRPVAFVVTDESASTVQLGLEHADLYFESETEAGIPRIMAVFSSADRLPETIGPIRSARPHFVKMAAALDAIYCHIGGSANGKQTIRKLGVTDIENAYEYNQILTNSANYSWNRKAFTQAKVTAQIRSRGIRITSDRPSPFAFGAKIGDRNATSVSVRVSESYTMAFSYDDSTGLYTKHRGNLSAPLHKTASGGTVTVSNVIVMYDTRFTDPMDDNRIDFTLSAGSGVLASGGTARDIRWTRTNDRLTFYEADGTTKLTVEEGKTYIALVSATLKSKTTMQ